MVEYVSPKAVEIAKAMGAREVLANPGLRDYDGTRYQSTHVQGGAIMGASKETSVVNPFLQHWDVPNLFVLGASAFPREFRRASDDDRPGPHTPRRGRHRGQIFETPRASRLKGE